MSSQCKTLRAVPIEVCAKAQKKALHDLGRRSYLVGPAGWRRQGSINSAAEGLESKRHQNSGNFSRAAFCWEDANARALAFSSAVRD